MTSFVRLSKLCTFQLTVLGMFAAVYLAGSQVATAQSIAVSFVFDGQSGAAASTQTLTAGAAGQTFTINVFATITGDATHTDTTKFGLKNIKYRGFSDIVSGGGAFATGTTIGYSGNFVGIAAFAALNTTAPKSADTGSTTDGSSIVATPDGIVDFGQNTLLGNASQSIPNFTFGTGTGSIEIAQFTFTTGQASAAGGSTTKFQPVIPNTNSGSNYTQDGTTAIIGQITPGAGLTFVVGGVAPPGSILNMTPPTVTINSLAGGTNSSTLAVANTNATSAGTYTGAFTGTSTGASQNPTGTVNVPASGSVNEVITYAAPATVGPVSFGYTITNTSNAADVQGAGANKSTAFTVNVGNAVADNSNALPNAANPFANATTMTAVVAHGSSYQGLESQVTSLSGTGGFNADDGTAAHKGGTAIILAGSNNLANGGGAATVAMQWRTLSTNAGFNEQTGAGPGFKGKIYSASLSAPTTGLVSNVVNLTGLTPGAEAAGGATDPFVLQMSFNPLLTAKQGTMVSGLAQNKLINLLSYNPTTNLWDRAVDDNIGTNPITPTSSSYGYVGSYAQFISAGQPGNGLTLAQTLGAWGADPVNDVVWADVNHNSQFAVVPEPGTILLAGLGLMGLVGLRRRMKASA